MSKPPFDPSKPFEAVNKKPPFDPNQPFDVPEQRGLLSKGVGMGLRALDFGGGLMRTGLAGISDTARLVKAGIDPNEEMADVQTSLRSGDAMRALTGDAPTSAQFMERAGVPEGGEIDLNPWAKGKTSTRDIVGFGADMATDPIGLLGKAAQPISRATQSLGRRMYKSGLKKIDEKTAEKGAKDFSDVLLERGAPSGSTASIQKSSREISEKLKNERQALYDIASEGGAKVDMFKATEGADEIIAKMRNNPGTEDQAEALAEFVNRYRDRGVVDIQDASDWKSALYESLPANSFGPNGKLKGGAKKVEKALAKGFKNQIEKSADKVQPGLGKKISSVNEDWGSVIQAQKPLERQVARGTTPNYVTSVDAMIGGLGSFYDPVAAMGALALKKGADLSKTTGARTMTGKGLLRASDYNIPDTIARRGLISGGRDE